jgi:hypothetical protein
MRSFVRKHPRFALTGGKGRKGLMLYEPADQLSARRVKLAAASPAERIDLLIEEHIRCVALLKANGQTERRN